MLNIDSIRKESSILHGDSPSFQLEGYLRFHLNALVKESALPEQIDALLRAYDNLPVDPYDGLASRYRRYGRAVYFPWNSTFSWIPGLSRDNGGVEQAYCQGPYNPEHVGQTRFFPAIETSLLSNPALMCIIKTILGTTYFDEINRRRPSLVGVHMISQKVSLEQPVANVSPNCMHQDGEMFDFVVLIGRQNVDGGENAIGSVQVANRALDTLAPDDVLARFTLSDEFEGFGVEDVKVSHGVEPICLSKGAESGYRNTLLVDVTPLAEDLRPFHPSLSEAQ